MTKKGPLLMTSWRSTGACNARCRYCNVDATGKCAPRELTTEEAKHLVDEVKSLIGCDLSLTAEKIIGIKEIKGYVEGLYPLEKAKALIKQNTRKLAKRQVTWFKKDKRIEWLDCDDLTSQAVTCTILDKLRLSS